MIDFQLPSLGADMDEGKLIEWKVKPGDAVKRGDVIAIIETAKAAVEMEIWQDGVVHELLTPPGEKVPVGTVMARLLAPGEAAPVPGSSPPSVPTVTPVRADDVAAAIPARTAAVTVSGQAEPSASRHPASPASRKAARELGVDIDQVVGTGPKGAVTVADVTAAAARTETSAPPDTAMRAEAMRAAIAAAMSRSKREIPHYYLSETIPLAAASAWLEAENARRPITARLLLAALYLKAVALACKAFPDLNGHYVEGTFRPALAAYVGVAISLRQGGLVAPAIQAVETLSLAEVMSQLADLVKRARAGSLRGSELSSPTITVTNLGDGGVESVHAVIHPPQVAIVGFGRVVQRPWVVAGAVRIAPLVIASLAADHRVSDGHRGALFLADIARRLQQPEQL